MPPDTQTTRPVKGSQQVFRLWGLQAVWVQITCVQESRGYVKLQADTKGRKQGFHCGMVLAKSDYTQQLTDLKQRETAATVKVYVHGLQPVTILYRTRCSPTFALDF